MKGKQILVMSFLMLFVLMAPLVEIAQADFTFQQPPRARFSFYPQSGTAPLTVTFVNNSMWADSYYWDFGDSFSEENTASSEHATHTFMKGGTFTVTLMCGT